MFICIDKKFIDLRYKCLKTRYKSSNGLSVNQFDNKLLKK